MAQPVPNLPPGFDELTVDEKIDYVESLWDAIVGGSEIPIPEWHQVLLKERIEAFRAAPNAGKPWGEVRDELRKRYSTGR